MDNNYKSIYNNSHYKNNDDNDDNDNNCNNNCNINNSNINTPITYQEYCNTHFQINNHNIRKYSNFNIFDDDDFDNPFKKTKFLPPPFKNYQPALSIQNRKIIEMEIEKIENQIEEARKRLVILRQLIVPPTSPPDITLSQTQPKTNNHLSDENVFQTTNNSKKNNSPQNSPPINFDSFNTLTKTPPLNSNHSNNNNVNIDDFNKLTPREKLIKSLLERRRAITSLSSSEIKTINPKIPERFNEKFFRLLFDGNLDVKEIPTQMESILYKYRFQLERFISTSSQIIKNSRYYYCLIDNHKSILPSYEELKKHLVTSHIDLIQITNIEETIHLDSDKAKCKHDGCIHIDSKKNISRHSKMFHHSDDMGITNSCFECNRNKKKIYLELAKELNIYDTYSNNNLINFDI
ncbi:hypothetical protein DICPUDRAFT_79852 [Dictyostelium purpureum]|uniref:Uncharacterized protein n=1 Tax=Dictyostelium purpureum TaxID=5786 RepID=F0ZNT8_DICPU|nr:uncharacterized protein DICPUDRAFT_79852 [Dictyostelium purpureum]EGC34397.1 hypothetical protein DICPUDRAFT_79852 [Dictyostelium purpureum]|eukprot:XP_003289071.1 hypothetical protein DICPUDRAFT_79852 [Dictyostelium purpureum]